MSTHHQHFSTLNLPPGRNSCRAWQETVCRTLFDLDISSSRPHFSGSLESKRIGRLDVARIRADPAVYTRTRAHLDRATEEEFLITLNTHNPVTFRQLGRDTVCGSGNFLLELSHEPYDFIARQSMDVHVFKVPKSLLKEYIRQPERYCALDFDGHSGIGLLFRRYALNAVAMLSDLNGADADMVEKQLLELFARAVEKDARVLASADSAVRAAHLLRIEQYANARLDRSDLSPEQTAAACQISVRYLHLLFKDTGTTFSDWLRSRRLETARHRLLQPHFNGTLAQLAYSLGFTDQSHFSKAYRRHFGESPRDTLNGRNNAV